jgi:hypothetical protein
VWAITPRPGGERYYIWDSELAGFGLRVAASGTKTFKDVETSQWRCIFGIEWHYHQEPRRLDAEGFADAINLG